VRRLLIPLGLGTLGAVAVFLVATWEPPGAEVAPDLAPAAPLPAARESVPPADDPEALAAWFQDQVTRHLGDSEASAQRGEARRAALADVGARRPVRLASAGAAPPFETERGGWNPSGRGDRDIDWAYLQDVFDGRVSGIPNETRAGISLQEMDELGDIPYVEQLRREKRYQELYELGFENETTPWPACLRKGTCRRDPVSSPP
jgi:hypothetical protein